MYKTITIITLAGLWGIVLFYTGCVWSVLINDWLEDKERYWDEKIIIPVFKHKADYDELFPFYTFLFPFITGICSILLALAWPLAWILIIGALILLRVRQTKRKQKEEKI